MITHTTRTSLRRRLWLQPLESRTTPATFTVQNLLDSGPGSLRAAVIAANGTPTADTIDFKFGLSGVIPLTGGEIAITAPLTIDGPGSDKLTLSGNNANRIFNTEAAPAMTAISVSGLRFTGGKHIDHGGAINSGDELLTLDHCTFTGNTTGFRGGAVMITGGAITATDCVFTKNSTLDSGAGLYAFPDAGFKTILMKCTFSGNTAGAGAVGASGYLLIENSTISNNTATLAGGGLILAQFGTDFDVTIRNSTISGNTAAIAGGGLVTANFPTGKLVIENSTITKNSAGTYGGGLETSFVSGVGKLTLQSSIVAQNTSSKGPDIWCTDPTSIAGNNNLIGVSDVGDFTLPGANNQKGLLIAPLNAKLSGLGNFGGPTLTHYPLAGSPVVNKGSNPSGKSTDQRGHIRNIGGGIDVGAVEVGPARFMVDTVVDENDGNYSPGDFSLREALALADITYSFQPIDTITFDPDVFSTKRTIALTLGELPITWPVSVTGPSAKVVIDAKGLSRIFNTQAGFAGMTVSLSNLELVNGKGVNFGGAILAGDENIALTNCALTNNILAIGGGSGGGGGVAINGGGTLTATDCVFSKNSAASSGGAISVFGGPDASITLTRCTVSGNTAPAGGGIYGHGYLLVEGSTIAANVASTGRGGGIWFNPVAGLGGLVVNNSTISGNSAKTDGGGIALTDTPANTIVIVRNSTITQNSTSANGGGIARTDGLITIQLESTVVAQNASSLGVPDMHFKSATNVPGDNNLVGVADRGNFTLTGVNNQKGTEVVPLDPMLSVLGSNGGPTPTHMPLTGSPVLDKGNNAQTFATDQRGAPRSFGMAPDVGAVEVQSAAVFVVDISADENDGNFAKGDLSLREAVSLANASPESADVITFDPTVFAVPRTILLKLGEMAIGTAIEVTGPGSHLLTINGNQKGRMFNLNTAPAMTAISLSGMAFTAGETTGTGGAITGAAGNLTLTSCLFTLNYAGGGGAVAHLGVGQLTVNDCQIITNAALGGGGAVIVAGTGASATLRRSTFADNFAATGGAIYAIGALLLEDSTVSGNAASSIGGGVRLANDYLPAMTNIRNSTISGNSAQGGGGIGLSELNGSLSVQNSTVTGNSASAFGGGIFFVTTYSGNFKLESTIVANNASADGPDIFTLGAVQAKSCAILSQDGISAFSDLGGNLPFGTDPRLLPLGDYGGPTQTHALKIDSPCIDKGTNPGLLLADQRGNSFTRTKLGGTDIGAVEWQGPVPTATIQVDNGSVQRSMVRSFTVTFSEAVSFPSGLSAAIKLVRNVITTPVVTLAFNQVGNVVTITFNDPVYAPAYGAKSLVDGNYTLTLFSDKIQGVNGFFDGNGDGYAGDNRVLLTHRLFGDADGDRDVDTNDYAVFRAAYGGGSSAIFDFEGDNDVDVSDYAQFRTRFGTSI